MEKKIVDTLESNDAMSEDMQEKLSRVIEKYQQLSDEEKDQFQKGAFDVLTKSLKKSLPSSTILPDWLAPYQIYIPFLVAVSVVVILFVVVGRKLYQRAKERESRKEEKRKRKEQKASKKKK